MKKSLFIIFTLASAFLAQAQTQTYKVYAIKFARSSYPFSAADWALGAPTTDSIKFAFSIWLIKGSNGRNILMDTGFLNDIEDAKEFKVADYVRPDSALAKLGLKPTDITDIILSHPHWDHIDGVSLFPNAQIWMQKEDFNYFVSTAWQKNNDRGGYAKRDVRIMIDLNLAGKVTLVDGDDKEIIPGIRVYTGSRHTFNSQFAVIQIGSNKVLLASDNIWIYYSLNHLVPPSAGGTLDPEGYVRAMKRMKTLVADPKFIIPGHDDKVYSMFPKVADGIVEIK